MPALSCTVFDQFRKVKSGSYTDVAIALKEFGRQQPEAQVLIFDDDSGKQIDFDLRGTDREITERIDQRFGAARSVGRPKLGVVSREVTLLPRHWEWLAQQPGGASTTLRKLVESAQKSGLDENAQRRKLQDRTYGFMSAIAGNMPNFEEAARALFASDDTRFKALISSWPQDIQEHVQRLNTAPPREIP